MSKVDVIMPQMGESIAEGTLTRWLKNVGDAVERDEDLFEISTDKVDADIPSPAAGVLAEVLVQDGGNGRNRHGRRPHRDGCHRRDARRTVGTPRPIRRRPIHRRTREL